MAALAISKLAGQQEKLRWKRNTNTVKRIKYKTQRHSLINPKPLPSNLTLEQIRDSRSITRNINKSRNGSIPTRRDKIKNEQIQERINILGENTKTAITWLHPFTGMAKNVPIATIGIDGKEVKCTVDTGATRVMITSEMAKELWGENYVQKLQKYPSNRSVEDAQGNPVEVQGYKQSQINIGQHLSTKYPIVVYKAEHKEILLGYSFLVDYNLAIYCGKGLGTQPQMEVVKRLNIEEAMECTPCEEEIIPPQAIKGIKVKIWFPDDWSNKERLAAIGSPIVIHSEDIENIPITNLTVQYTYDILSIDNTANVIIDNSENLEPLHISKEEIIAHAEFVKEEVSQDQIRRIIDDSSYSINDAEMGELKLQDEIQPTRFEYIDKINIKSQEEGTEEFCKNLLKETEPFWSKHNFDLGCYDKKARMTLQHTNPIQDKYRPINPRKEKQAQEIIDQLEKHNIIKRGNSPYCAQPCWVWKKPKDKTGKAAVAGEADMSAPRALRLALDYRKVNKLISSQCHFPNPSIREILFKLKQAKYVSIIDLTNSYWNIELSESTKPILAFQTSQAQYLWNRLPQGTNPSMSIMAQAVQDTLHTGGISDICTCYVDNIIVMSSNLEQHKLDLKKTIDAFIKRGWKANPGKSHLFVNTECRLFGFNINLAQGTIGPDPQKVKAIMELPPPTNQKSARSLCGSINYYSDLIPDLAPLMKPLHEITKDDKFQWTQECEENFQQIKKKLSELPIIYMPDFNKPMHLFTDAAQGQYLGYHISQWNELKNKFVPIAWGSHKFNKHEQSMSQPEAELYAIIYAVIQESLLLGFSKIIAHTDCRSLTYLFRFAKICSKLNRWQLILNSFDLEIYFESSESIGIIMADMLSRRPGKRVTNRRPKIQEIEELPKVDLRHKPKLSFQEAKEEINKELNKLPSITHDTIKYFQEKYTPMVIRPEDLECNKAIVDRITQSADKIEEYKDNNYKHQYVYTPEQLAYRNDISPSGRLINLVLQEAPGLSLNGLRAHQLSDPFFGPKVKEMMESNAAIQGYALKDGILLKENEDTSSNISYLICVPRSLSLELIGKFHYSVFGAHPDLKKLISNLKKRFFIKNMKNECQEILKNCQICSLNKSFNTMKQPFGAKITVTGPRQIYALDICTVDTQVKEIDTDLPTSFLIITDAWSLYTICVPINANATCREILEKFSRHIIQPFGIPKIGITTDGGKNFSCKLSNTFTAVLGLQQFRISPFNARSNPAERVNRAILSGLRYASQQFHLEPEVFKNLLNYIVLSWNTTALSSIKFSPYELFLSTPYEPACLSSFVTIHEADRADYGDFISALVKSQHIVENLVNDRYQKIRDKRYAEKAQKSKYSEYAPGTQVMIKKRIDQTKRAHKLRPRYTGPYKIIREFPNNVEVIPWSRDKRTKLISKYKNEAQGIPKFEKFLISKDRIKPCSNLTYYYDEALARKFYQTFWDVVKDVEPIKTVERHITPTDYVDKQPTHRPSSLILPAQLGIRNNPIPAQNVLKPKKCTTKRKKLHSNTTSSGASSNRMDGASMNRGSTQRSEYATPRTSTQGDDSSSSDDDPPDDHNQDNNAIQNNDLETTTHSDVSREDDSSSASEDEPQGASGHHRNQFIQQPPQPPPILHLVGQLPKQKGTQLPKCTKSSQSKGVAPHTPLPYTLTYPERVDKWVVRKGPRVPQPATMIGFGNSGRVIIVPDHPANDEDELDPQPGPSHPPRDPVLPQTGARSKDNQQQQQTNRAKSTASTKTGKSQKSKRSTMDPACKEAISSKNSLFQDMEFDKLKEYYTQGSIDKDIQNMSDQIEEDYQNIENILDNEEEEDNEEINQ